MTPIPLFLGCRGSLAGLHLHVEGDPGGAPPQRQGPAVGADVLEIPGQDLLKRAFGNGHGKPDLIIRPRRAHSAFSASIARSTSSSAQERV